MEKVTVNGREFQVLRLLGKGKGGYSWLVSDDSGSYVLKQIHHEPCDYYTFGDKLASELRDYETLRKVGIPLPELLDVDQAQERLLKAYIDGPTVNVLVKENRMQPEYYEQIREMCRVLYAAGLNIDYYPTNFVLQEGKLWYIDYECNPYSDQWNYENWGSKYWARTEDFIAAFGV